MIKWFCDVCGLEIVSPENPVHVSAHRAGKNRDHADAYWGESHDIIEVFAHKACADVLVSEIKGALATATRVVKNNAPTTSRP